MKVRMIWILASLALISSSASSEDFECPYSGPDFESQMGFDVSQYQIHLQIVFPQTPELGYIMGFTQLSFTVLTEAISEIDLDFYKATEATIFGVELNGQSCAYRVEPNEIILMPTTVLAAGSTHSVMVSYRGDGMAYFQFKPKDNARYGYNKMVENSRWFPCLHDPRDKAVYEFNIRVAQDKFAACNGELISAIDQGDGTVIYQWIESFPMASYLATVNIADYVSFSRTHHGIPIYYYVVSESLENAQEDFQNDGLILDFFTSTFGPYPFAKLGVAQVPIAGAMENQDMISYGTVFITGDRTYEDTFAHEISHMWWGDSVTLTGCEDVWLNEGFASYCEALWEEHLNGQAAYDNVMNNFKTDYFEFDETYRFPIYDPEIVWCATTYDKAAWVLHMLRRIIGDEVFFAVLPDYYDRYKFSNATTSDFQNVCEEHFDSDLNWFFQQWIFDQGYPEFVVTHEYLESVETERITVEQIQTDAPPVFIMPVKVKLNFDDSTSEIIQMMLDEKFELLDYGTHKHVTSVELDPDSSVLCKVNYANPVPRTEVILAMPSHQFHQGDDCWVKVLVRNANSTPLEQYPLFVILEAYSSFFFAPSYSDYDNYLIQHPTFPTGDTSVTVIDTFTWPDIGQSNAVLTWYAALTDPQITRIEGILDLWEFEWR